MLILDDRHSGTLQANNGATWRAVSDTVMGGVSHCQLITTVLHDKPCVCLQGEVSLANNGGFIQASLDLAAPDYLDASAYTGIEIEVCGNRETYNLHLRTRDTRIVWQSYRASFIAHAQWQTLRIPFTAFQPHRLSAPLNLHELRRLGVVAIGRAMQAEVGIARLSLVKS